MTISGKFITALEREPRMEQPEMKIMAGPAQRNGATGSMLSVYFDDPDSNLVEVGVLVRGTPTGAAAIAALPGGN
jgi:hypothetical protein